MKSQKRMPAPPAAWQTPPYANLVRCVPSGKYLARIRIGGKLIRQSLKTKVLSVAKLRLRDLEELERSNWEAQAALEQGDDAFQDLVKLWRERLEADHSINPRTKTSHEERLVRVRLDR